MSFQINYLLAQIEGERKAFFGRVQEGASQCVRLSPLALRRYKR